MNLHPFRFRALGIVAAWGLLAVLAGCGGGGGGGGTHPAVTVSLTGRVADATNDAGVAGARVTLLPSSRGRAASRAESWSTVTGSDGTYSLVVPPGSATMSVDLPDGSYQSVVVEIAISSDRPALSVSIRLVPRDVASPTAVTLTPRNPSVSVGGTVQFTAEVTPASPVKPFFCVQGDVGTISVDGLFTATKVGTGQVMALAGNARDITTVTVTTAPPTTGSVTGLVTDSSGQPLAGVTVSGGGQSASTGTDGAYTLALLPPGSVELTASKPGFGTMAQSVTVTAGQTTTVNWSLSPVPVVVIRIDPQAVVLDPGATQTFSVLVTGTENTAVGWSIQEGAAGGSLSVGGDGSATYTTPTTRGTYHVVVTSQADPSKSAVATVTVESATHNIIIQ